MRVGILLVGKLLLKDKYNIPTSMLYIVQAKLSWSQYNHFNLYENLLHRCYQNDRLLNTRCRTFPSFFALHLIFIFSALFNVLWLNTTLCNKVCQWLTACRWFSPGTPVSFTNKTDRHDINEILLKVALNTITLVLTLILIHFLDWNRPLEKDKFWQFYISFLINV